MNRNENMKGITLVALIITIIVMLILVGVSISIAINGGLFDAVKKAAKETQNAANFEQALANGRIKIGDTWYDSIEDYINDKPSINQEEMPEGQGNITFNYSTKNWTNQDVNVTITKGNAASSYTLQYSKDNKTWEDYTEAVPMSSNGEIYARLVDSNGNIETTATGKVANIDKTAPNITLKQTDTTTKEYQKKVSVSATDNESGISVIKYAPGIKDLAYFENNGTVLSNNTFDVTTADYTPTLSRFDISNIVYTIYTKNNAGTDTIETITISNLLIDYYVTGSSGLEVRNGAIIDESTGNIKIAGSWGEEMQCGPYCTLPAGIYEITYSGTNLNNLSYWSYVSPNAYYHKKTEEISHYTITLNETTSLMEFVAQSNGVNEATITGIRIRQIDGEVLYSYGKQYAPFTDEFTNFNTDKTINYINFESDYIEIVVASNRASLAVVSCAKQIDFSDYKYLCFVVNKDPAEDRIRNI